MLIYGPRCHEHGLQGYGNSSAKVMFIGIAPSSQEVKIDRPLTGPNGQLLDAILTGIHYSRELIYCTNLVCWQTNTPTQQEIESCFPRLLQEINLIKPKLIVTLGKAVEDVLCLPNQARGETRWHPELQCYIMPTIHPQALLRGNTFLIHNLIRDITKIKTLIDLPPNDISKDAPFILIDSKAAAQAALNLLPLDRPVAIDIETDNPSYEDEKSDYIEDSLLSLSISDGTLTFTIPAAFAQGLVWPEAVQYTFHNGMFDAQGIYRYLGVMLPIVEDTMLMSYTLDERAGFHGLKPLAKEYLAVGSYEPTTKIKRKNNFSEIPKTELYEYNAKDAAYTARLASIFIPMQHEDDVYNVYHNLLIPAANAFVPVLHRGVYVDKKRIHDLFMEWAPKLIDQETALLKIAANYGLPNINFNSPRQVSNLLYNRMKLPGGPSTDVKTLEPLRATNTFVDSLLAYRRLEHLITNYLIGMQDRIKRDGRLHPNVLLHSTVTGRLSYRDPALQTMPKADKVGEDLGRIRQIFCATNEDYILVEVDYKQAEMWYAYYHSKDSALLNALQTDVHRSTAAFVNKISLEEVTPIQRAKAKITNFGIIYGAGPSTLAAQYPNFSIEEASVYHAAFFEKYHIYKDWFDLTKEKALIDGELQSLTGRKRRFRIASGPDGSRILNQAVNFPIQCCASDTTLKSFIELQSALVPFDSHVLILVHDSILFEVNKKHLIPVLSLIEEIMTKTHIPTCGPVPVEIAVGPNWYDLKKVNNVCS